MTPAVRPLRPAARPSRAAALATVVAVAVLAPAAGLLVANWEPPRRMRIRP